MSPLRNGNIPEERRCHIRHRLTSIIYVELGPGNGGIIVSLGTGGLSLHAATKLNAETELALRFRLDPNEEPIETAGRVVWLGPTHKEAGICFKDLPADAERRIANWIAAQEHPVPIAQGEPGPPKSRSMSGAAPTISIQAPVPASRATERFENTQPSLSLGNPRRVLSEPSQPAQFSNAAPGLQRTTPPSPAIAFPTPEERLERPSDKLLRGAPAKRYEILPKPAKPAPAAQELVPKDARLPALTPSPVKVIEVSRQTPQAIEVSPQASQTNDSAASKLRQQRKLAFTVAACSAGILVLMVTIMSVSKPPADRDSSGESAEPISSGAAAQAASAPQAAPGAPTDAGAGTDTSADAPVPADYDLLPILPTHLPASVPRDGDWGAQVESMFGIDVPMKINPAVLGLPVWTVQHSGYYYCVDSLNSETPQTGALMLQGEALQTGYQPKLGKYCN